MTFRQTLRRYILKILSIYPYKITVLSDLNYLKDMGCKIGSNFSMQQGCIIDDSHCWLISIGDNVTLAPNVHIMAHDASTKDALGYTKIAPVTIGNHVFIGAKSLILPGVTIGDRVVIGAGSVISKNVPDNSVVVGVNHIIKTYETYMKEMQEDLGKAQQEGRVFDSSYTVAHGVSEMQKKEMLLKNGGFIV